MLRGREDVALTIWLNRRQIAGPSGVPAWTANDDCDQFRGGSRWTWLATLFGCEQQSVLSFYQRSVEAQKSGGLDHDGRAEQTSGAHEACAQARNDTVHRSKRWRSTSGAVQDKKLVLDEK
jgi:hypothetical protein